MTIIRLAVACYTASLFLILSLTSVRAEHPDTIPVGVSLALTGTGAPMSLDIKDGLIFANEHFFQNKYSLIFEDDKCEPTTGLSIAQKFISLDRVKFVLGLLCNTVLLSTAPLYNKAGTLVITAGATSGDVHGIGRRIFRPYPADQLAVPPLYSHVKSHHRNLGILTQEDAYTELLERAFIRIAGEEKFPLIIERVSGNNFDFRSALLRIKSRGAESVMLNMMGEDPYINAAKQAHQLGLRVPIYSNILAGSRVVQEALGTLNEGAIYTDINSSSLDKDEETQKIFNEIESKYGKRRSALIFTALGVDTLKILDTALRSKVPAEDYLRSQAFDGISGKITFDNDGAATGMGYSLFQVKDGEGRIQDIH